MLPYAVKPMCYDTMARWQEDLMYLHAEGETITRRQDLGKHAGRRTVTAVFDPKRIDYCAMCDIGSAYQRRMQAERRCILQAAVSIPEVEL